MLDFFFFYPGSRGVLVLLHYTRCDAELPGAHTRGSGSLSSVLRVRAAEG